MEENHKIDNHKEDPEKDGTDDERRKGMDRRWIKSGYPGPERRKPDERREKKDKRDGDFDPSRL